MAQRFDSDTMLARVTHMFRQRPALLIAVVLVAASLCAAAAFGILQAGGSSGIEIDRAGAERPAADDDGEAGDEATREKDADASTGGEREDGAAQDRGEAVVVDVCGAVVSPAVVTLDAGMRVQDAIEAAGGLTDDADISSVNRASVLVDGQKVYIPRQGETASPGADPSGAASGDGVSGSSQGQSGLVNINTADASALDELPGVGPSTAQAIIEDRERNGSFASIEDLMRVSGIGEKKFEKLKSSICV